MLTDRDKRMRKKWRSRVSLLLVAALLVGAVAGADAALAQDPTDDPVAAQYDPPLSDDAGTAGTASAGTSGLESNIGSLPLTGLDLLIVLGVTLLLAGTGFALRRLSTPLGPRA